jgi:hypothetical protein
MIAAALVNFHYLLILLLPLLVGLLALGLTWYSRVKRRREADARRLTRAAGTRPGAAGKPRSGGANVRSASSSKARSGSAKRRR